MYWKDGCKLGEIIEYISVSMRMEKNNKIRVV